MHSPLEIARNYIEVGIHKVNLSIFKTILLGFFAGMFIGFAGIASTTASSTIGIASVAKLVGAAVFPAGMAMVLVAGSELFTGNNLIILAVLEKKVTVWKMLKNWLFVYVGNFLGAAFVAVLVVVGRTPDSLRRAAGTGNCQCCCSPDEFKRGRGFRARHSVQYSGVYCGMDVFCGEACLRQASDQLLACDAVRVMWF